MADSFKSADWASEAGSAQSGRPLISLKQAYEQASVRVAFYCVRPGISAHVGKMDIESDETVRPGALV